MENKISKSDLEKIRIHTRKDMSEDELYVFSLILCDNEIDRDGEKFTVNTLNKLSKLFIGATGGIDHNLSSKDQNARIFETEVVTDGSRKTADGEKYTFLKAKAYMVRTNTNKDLIAEIEAGIKKETSVNCSVRSRTCSICGKRIGFEDCRHVKGEVYGGKICCHVLEEPDDAYEWSFVAVPAQKNAGVIKSHSPEGETNHPALIEEYRKELKEDIIRDGSKIVPNLSSELLGKVCDYLPLAELHSLRKSFSKECRKITAPISRLASDSENKSDNNDYIF